MTRRRLAARAAAVGAVAAGCHFGPFVDVHDAAIGPDVREIVRRGPRPGATLGDLLDLAGPPTRIERRRDELFLWWERRTFTREWIGLGLGALGFNLQLVDRSTSRRAGERLLCVVRDGRVVAVGTTPPDALSAGAAARTP